MTDYEKLGAFYLGRPYDDAGKETVDEPFLYDAKDLTTHAVIVGMTGSGKTGLGVGLLEEAAIDGVPSIAIDPKGDLANLALTFPKLAPGDFEPWIDPGEAARKGRTVSEHAKATADMWRNGLASWHQEPARIQRFRDAADVVVYTPGSNAGIPIDVLRSFSAPPAAVLDDDDALRDRVAATATSVLSLLGVDADPLRSREHILISTLFDRAWRAGEDLDLPSLIRSIQDPPFRKVGVFDLDAFFPADERLELAMTINNLVASPGFSVWTEGEPLDVAKLLYGDDGRPRISVLSIAHLSDSERMFFVTLLLNEVLSWVRSQPGSRTLRALLYMDEIFGYFPPTANPPSKKPMLTLLKQARAYGLGVVLSTQNPVDLDYKGLANTGTWFLGRLQTERDKLRVIDGLEGASAASGATFDRAHVERLLSGLGSRVFLLNNVHEDGPVLFQTRWVLSYLAGPMTREHIKRLTPDGARASTRAAAKAAPATRAKSAPRRAAKATPVGGGRPILAKGVGEVFGREDDFGTAVGRLLYRPTLLATATLHYADSRAGLDVWKTVHVQTELDPRATGTPWTEATFLDRRPGVTATPSDEEADFSELPDGVSRKTTFTTWAKMLKSHLYRERALILYRCKRLKLTSTHEESEGEFLVRVRDAIREERDVDIEKMRKRYAPKLQRVREQIGRAEAALGKERDQYEARKSKNMMSWGSTLLGALFGRKLGSGTVSKAATAAKGMSSVEKEKRDIARAEEKIEQLEQKYADLERDFEDDLDTVRAEHDEDQYPIDEKVVRPRKSDLSVDELVVAWTPWRVGDDGVAEPSGAR